MLQDQYLAFNLSNVPLSQPCLALNDFRRLGFDFFMVMFASPNLTIFSLPLSQAFTTNFLPPET